MYSGDGSFEERMERIKELKKYGFTKVKCAVGMAGFWSCSFES